MMGKRNFWDEIELGAKSGKHVTVKLEAAQEVVTPTSPYGVRGRPRRTDRERKACGQVQTRYVMNTGKPQNPMTCRMPGCGTRIPTQTEDIVCSDRCRAAFMEYLEINLEILYGLSAAIDYPMEYRSNKRFWSSPNGIHKYRERWEKKNLKARLEKKKAEREAKARGE